MSNIRTNIFIVVEKLVGSVVMRVSVVLAVGVCVCNVSLVLLTPRDH